MHLLALFLSRPGTLPYDWARPAPGKPVELDRWRREPAVTNEIRRLYRSRDERMIAGVCGGLGEYFSIDPTLVRVLFVVAAVVGGWGLLAYLLLLIIVPLTPLPPSP
jgi:phage shock protein C